MYVCVFVSIHIHIHGFYTYMHLLIMTYSEIAHGREGLRLWVEGTNSAFFKENLQGKCFATHLLHMYERNDVCIISNAKNVYMYIYTYVIHVCIFRGFILLWRSKREKSMSTRETTIRVYIHVFVDIHMYVYAYIYNAYEGNNNT